MASAISYVYVFFQAVAPLFICAICTGEGLCAGGKKPKLTVLFAVRGQEFHKDGYHITLEKSGKFYDLDGHVITDQQLKKDLLEASPGDPEDKRYIQFHVEVENKTNVSTLGDAMLRIRSAADSQKETVVVVNIKALTAKQK